MSFRHNYDGTKESGDFIPAPKADYFLRIVEVKEGLTKNNDKNATVKLVITEGKYTNTIVWHNVSFIQPGNPGAGISKHWLHSIGQPYEGDVDVEPQNWVGIVIFVALDIADYINKNEETKQKNVIKKIISVQDGTNQTGQEEEETSF